MKRSILWQYVDACELLKETEKDIDRLEKTHPEILHDKVYGSNPNFPYEARGFSIYGAADTPSDHKRILAEKQRLLQERKRKAMELKIRVEEWMNTLPPRTIRIIRFHFFQGLSWSDTAKRIGRDATADSVRMEINKLFIK